MKNFIGLLGAPAVDATAQGYDEFLHTHPGWLEAHPGWGPADYKKMVQEHGPKHEGHARGGVIHGPTHALVGEAGIEVILPVSKAPDWNAEATKIAAHWLNANQPSHFADGGVVADDGCVALPNWQSTGTG